MNVLPERDGAVVPLAYPLAKLWMCNYTRTPTAVNSYFSDGKNGNVCWQGGYDTKAFADEVKPQTSRTSRLAGTRCGSREQTSETSVSRGDANKKGWQWFLPPCPSENLLPHDDNHKGIRLHLPSPLSRSRRIKIRRGHINIVRLQVQTHGASAALGWDILHNREFVG